MSSETSLEGGAPPLGEQPPWESAICLSGGGVRSAAFSIGVLQAVDRALGVDGGCGGGRNFTYLSAVSGGAFAGAWYRTRLQEYRTNEAGSQSLADGVRQLRRKGGYLNLPSHQLLLSFLAKLLLYWLFLIPATWTALLSLAGLWAGLGLAGQRLQHVAGGGAPVGPGVVIVGGAAALLIALQFDRGRSWVAGLTGVVLASWAAHGLMRSEGSFAFLAAGGIPAAALALLLQASHSPLLRSLTRHLGAARLVHLAAWLSIGLLVALCAWALRASLGWFDGYFELIANTTYSEWLPQPLSLIPLLAAVTLATGLMPVTWISLAELYRDRIRRGFVLARTTLDELPETPSLIINVAASADERAHREWDERKAAAFAWTPTGYVNLLEKEQPRERFALEEASYGEQAIDLSLAVATSAAVAGPRMGSYTARAIGLLLTFFNVRLGQWFKLEDEKNRFALAGSIWGLVVAEVFRRKRTGWVHLTDGGHFENLGLYEVVRRRCKHILVVDASCDPRYRFSDLANALRKIRIDLGVEIEIDGLRWTEDGSVLESPSAGQRQRVYGGTIRYPRTDSRAGFDYGKIVYVKAALIGDEPADVAGYADLHPAFPHESTADQWFSESQFESYRRLGEFTIDSALQHYEDAKELWARRGSRRREGTNRTAAADVTLVEKLREAGMIAGRPELRPTHGGAVVCGSGAASDAGPVRWLLVIATGGGSWVLPKGHIERGETPFDCARRELAEEAGIDWPERANGRPRSRAGIVYDQFRKDGDQVRCAYYVLDLRAETAACTYPDHPVPDGLRTPIRIEDRDQIWITADEYARALQLHPASPKELKEESRQRDAPGTAAGDGPYDRKLAAARVLIPGLLWILEEAERKLGGDAAF